MLAVCVQIGMLFYVMSLPAPGGKDVKIFCIAADVAALVWNSLGIIVCRIPRLSVKLPASLAEAATVLFLCSNMLPVFLVDAWYASKLLGRDPLDTWRPGTNFSDTRPLLALSALVLGTHVALPVRWVAFLPLAVFAVLLYSAFAFGLGGPDGWEAWSTVLLLTGVIACGVIGRRTIEMHERDALFQIIQERNLRVQTEFQLSQMENSRTPNRAPEDDRASSARESRPETTDSAKVFDCTDPAEVAKLGREEQWYISRGEIVVGSEVLGEGSFGSVVEGALHGSPVAVKKAVAPNRKRNDRDNEFERSRLSLLNEVRILRRLRHPNIVLFHGLSIDDDGDNFLLILERVQGVPMDKAITEGDLEKEALSPVDRFCAILDINRALRYLHARYPSIVHGDLKANNTFAEMLPGKCGLIRAKLLDFGLSRALTRHAKPLGGSLMWIAPEVALQETQPSLASDVFSFGRLVFFIAAGRYPSPLGMSSGDYMKLFKAGQVPPLVWPEDAVAMARAFRAIAQSCSRFMARSRPTMEEIGQQLDDVDLEDLIQGGGLRLPIASAARPSSEAPGALRPSVEVPSASSLFSHRLSDHAEEAPQREPVLPCFKPTPQETTMSIIVDAIGRINFMPPEEGAPCCLYHAALQHVHTLVTDLTDLQCKETPFKFVQAQCPFCLTLLQPQYDGIMSPGLANTSHERRSLAGGSHVLACPTCSTNVEVNPRCTL